MTRTPVEMLEEANIWLQALIHEGDIDPDDTNIKIKVGNKNTGAERVVAEKNLGEFIREIIAFTGAEFEQE